MLKNYFYDMLLIQTSDIALYVSNKHVKFGANAAFSSFECIGNYVLSIHNGI